MRNILLHYQAYLYPVIVGVASLILIVLVIVPQIQDFLEGQQNINQQQAKVSALEVKAKGLGEIDQISFAEKLTSALQSLPVEKDYSTIIGVFRDLVAASGTSLESIRVSGGAEEKGSFTVRLEVAGTNQALEKLLSALDTAARTMKVKSIDITSNGEFISAGLTIDVYYAPAPQTLGSIDSPLPEFSDKDKQLLNNITQATKQQPVNVVLPAGKTNPFE